MARPVKTRGARPPTRWSQEVTASSDALDLDPGVFALESAAVSRGL
ncbi:MAG TPA: hypothetical protein VMJ75_11505 [Candidatus Acidoferrales bacterium]|nr:hypothetical protein [Candidatus Acidoferrales bacterium]